jgi:dTMP kinase
MAKKTKGKLIVIDGTDGSGKATQAAFLAARLKKEGYKVASIDFPKYDENFFGAFIGRCLSRQYYNFVKVHPKIASVLYAADRWESKEKIENWLKKGYVVIADRYASANQIHQGGKIKSEKKRREFLQWLDEMEYKVFKIPRPNLVLYLSLPLQTMRQLIAKRDTKAVRAYLGKGQDVHEKDMKHLENARESALKLLKELNNFKKIDSAPQGELLPPAVIHEKVYEEVLKII